MRIAFITTHFISPINFPISKTKAKTITEETEHYFDSSKIFKRNLLDWSTLDYFDPGP
jgi:hypothetical protein